MSGKGTGLGLSTVLGIVTQSGGAIRVDSETGRGAEFRIYLPRLDGDETGAAAGVRPRPGRGTENILLVEDDAQLRAVLRRALGEHGYQMIEATTATQASVLAKGLAPPPDLLVTDVILPEGNGVDLAREVQAVLPGLPVLFVSGYTGEHLAALDALPDARFLPKPFTPDVLLERVREALDGSRRLRAATDRPLRRRGCRARRRAVSDLLAARALFGTSLAFHIVFAAVGVAMPLLMIVAEWRGRRTGSDVHLEVARRWAKGAAILFAVGAVSGTVIAFELGLLFPRFMAFASPIIGLPFALEGFAFFAEAIFLGIYLYGWERVSPRLHLVAGAVVAASGALSAFFVTLANAWMNHPAGFVLVDGNPASIDPLAAMFAPGWAEQVLHVLLSCYAATGLAVAGIHAVLLRRDRSSDFHRAALGVALAVGGAAALLQPFSGDLSARSVAMRQPVKLAALEGQFATERGAPLRIGGIPDAGARVTRWAVEIPRGLSLLAFHDPDAEVKGLEDFPRDTWPDPLKVHLAFQVMVGLGTAMAGLSLVALALRWRRREWLRHPRFLALVALLGPAGFVALEAGWLVTEWGRQPFTIWGVMRTADAVTPVGGLAVPFVAFNLLYVFLGLVTAALLVRQIAHAPRSGAAAAAETAP